MSTGSGYRYESSGAISEGTVYSQKVSNLYNNHHVYIEFYSDSKLSQVVDKSTMTGSITITATPSDSQNAGVNEEYLSVANGTITLGTSDYNPPSAAGSVKRVKAVFNTVVGATHYKLIVASFGG